MSLMEVTWHVLRVKICSLSHNQTPWIHEARCTLQGEAKPHILRLISGEVCTSKLFLITTENNIPEKNIYCFMNVHKVKGKESLKLCIGLLSFHLSSTV